MVGFFIGGMVIPSILKKWKVLGIAIDSGTNTTDNLTVNQGQIPITKPELNKLPNNNRKFRIGRTVLVGIVIPLGIFLFLLLIFFGAKPSNAGGGWALMLILYAIAGLIPAIGVGWLVWIVLVGWYNAMSRDTKKIVHKIGLLILALTIIWSIWSSYSPVTSLLFP